MRATILLGTLKKEGLSNTATLSEFFSRRLERSGVECETIRLVDRHILPGTYSDMGTGDEWPAILDTLLRSQIIIVATPIWWSNHSSLIQRANCAPSASPRHHRQVPNAAPVAAASSTQYLRRSTDSTAKSYNSFDLGPPKHRN